MSTSTLTRIFRFLPRGRSGRGCVSSNAGGSQAEMALDEQLHEVEIGGTEDV